MAIAGHRSLDTVWKIEENLKPTVHPLFLRAELLYIINDEMARDLEDVTLRRTKWITS